MNGEHSLLYKYLIRHFQPLIEFLVLFVTSSVAFALTHQIIGIFYFKCRCFRREQKQNQRQCVLREKETFTKLFGTFENGNTVRANKLALLFCNKQINLQIFYIVLNITIPTKAFNNSSHCILAHQYNLVTYP